MISLLILALESWPHHYYPEHKRQSMEYYKPGPQSVKKLKTILPVLWPQKVILKIFEMQGMWCTKNYCLREWQLIPNGIGKLNLYRNVWKEDFHLHHDNARPHCSWETMETVTGFKFTCVPHTIYSSDLSPSNFWLSLKLKGQHFSPSAEAEAVCKWFKTKPLFFHGQNAKIAWMFVWKNV